MKVVDYCDGDHYYYWYGDHWDDDGDYWDDDKNKLFEWYDGYKKRKAKKELTPIAWNPSRWWGWCMSEEEKKETEKLWA